MRCVEAAGCYLAGIKTAVQIGFITIIAKAVCDLAKAVFDLAKAVCDATIVYKLLMRD